MTFRELQQQICTAMAHVTDECFADPHDEWPTLALLESNAGKMTLLLGAGASLPALIEPVVRRERARKLVSVTAGWLHDDQARAGELGPVRFRPADVFCWLPTDQGDREALLVVVLDEERSESWIALVERDGTNPPTLGDWQFAGEPAGPTVDPLKRALR
jgi:hypothetical protein